MTEPGANDLYNQLDEETKNFYQFHGVQLISINFPPKADLIQKLYYKLKDQIFDAGHAFKILDNEELESFQVVAQQDIQPESDIYLVDHALSFRYSQLRKNLEGNSGLQERLKNILKYSTTKKDHPDFPKNKKSFDGLKEYDDQDIEDPNDLEVPNDAIALSLWGNNISDLNLLRTFLEKIKGLKALWLNGNPIATKENQESLYEFIETNFPDIELLNSSFTKNAGEWGLKFATLYPKIYNIPKINIETLKTIDLSDRNIFRIKDTEVFAKLKELRTIDLRGHKLDDLVETNKLIGVLQKIPKLQHLIVDQELADILWTLHENKKLDLVCANLKSINTYYLSYGRPAPEEQDVKYIIDNIWKLAGSYRIASSEKLDESSVWYVMDEFGSSIQHQDNPNTQIHPFLYAPNNKLDAHTISYNVLWVTKEVKAEETITRDYLNGIEESKFRQARLNVWFDLPKKPFILKNNEKLENIRKKERSQEEILEIIEKNTNKNIQLREQNKLNGQKNAPWTVATDSLQVAEYLSDPNFVLTKNVDEAKILWMNANLKEELQQYPDKFINQFPYESCLISKNNLANTLYEAYGPCRLIKMTYNLDKELDAFVGEFLTRQKAGEQNYWILKPPNMTRSMDMVVTNNLDLILRNLETGPKLAQKYIENPFTFNKKKIDFRFNILARSLEPLDILLHQNFFIRSSFHEFTMDPRTLMTYENHFTVMNYLGDPNKLTKVNYLDFIAKFNEMGQEKSISWEHTYEKIRQAVREVFIAAKLLYPQMHNEKARAIYGLDLMFDEDLNPYVLEITFQPDNTRVSQVYPFIYNNIFNSLYLYNEENNNVDRLL